MLTEAILLEQNKRLREENDELRETLRQMTTDRAQLAPLPDGLPYFTPFEERIFRGLLEARSVASKEWLYDALYPAGEIRERQIVMVMVSRLRKKLAGTGFQIETVWGRGYKLARAAEVNKTLTGLVQAGVSTDAETLAA
jgi:DNA-binding response OmpR family regulator